jgi:hypothetical protein
MSIKNSISEMLDWNNESAKGADYAKTGFAIHTIFVAIASIGIAFIVGISTTLTGVEKSLIALGILGIGVSLVVFGRIVLELFRTVFKVERQLTVLQDLGRQNRIRPNLELIEAELKEISSRNYEEVLQPILLQIERHLATPKEIAPQESLLLALERIHEQLEATRHDYSRATLDSTLRNIESNLDSLSKQNSAEAVISNIDDLKLQLLHQTSEAPDSSLQTTLSAIEKYLESIAQSSKPKKRVKKAAVKKAPAKKAVQKKEVKKTGRTKVLGSSQKKRKPVSKSAKKKS